MWWERLSQDVRYAARMLRKSAAFTITSVLSLELGIGATTAVFSVVDATLLHPLPYAQPDRLVSVQADLPGAGSYDVGMSQPEWRDLDRSGIFEQIAPAWFDENNPTGASRPMQVRQCSVAPNYFAALGVEPQLDGRSRPAIARPATRSRPSSATACGSASSAPIRAFWEGNQARHGPLPHRRRHAGGLSSTRTDADERNVDVWAATSFYGPPMPDHPPGTDGTCRAQSPA